MSESRQSTNQEEPRTAARPQSDGGAASNPVAMRRSNSGGGATNAVFSSAPPLTTTTFVGGSSRNRYASAAAAVGCFRAASAASLSAASSSFSSSQQQQQQMSRGPSSVRLSLRAASSNHHNTSSQARTASNAAPSELSQQQQQSMVVMSLDKAACLKFFDGGWYAPDAKGILRRCSSSNNDDTTTTTTTTATTTTNDDDSMNSKSVSAPPPPATNDHHRQYLGKCKLCASKNLLFVCAMGAGPQTFGDLCGIAVNHLRRQHPVEFNSERGPSSSMPRAATVGRPSPSLQRPPSSFVIPPTPPSHQQQPTVRVPSTASAALMNVPAAPPLVEVVSSDDDDEGNAEQQESAKTLALAPPAAVTTDTAPPPTYTDNNAALGSADDEAKNTTANDDANNSFVAAGANPPPPLFSNLATLSQTSSSQFEGTQRTPDGASTIISNHNNQLNGRLDGEGPTAINSITPQQTQIASQLQFEEEEEEDGGREEDSADILLNPKHPLGVEEADDNSAVSKFIKADETTKIADVPPQEAPTKTTTMPTASAAKRVVFEETDAEEGECKKKTKDGGGAEKSAKEEEGDATLTPAPVTTKIAFVPDYFFREDVARKRGIGSRIVSMGPSSASSTKGRNETKTTDASGPLTTVGAVVGGFSVAAAPAPSSFLTEGNDANNNAADNKNKKVISNDNDLDDGDDNNNDESDIAFQSMLNIYKKHWKQAAAQSSAFRNVIDSFLTKERLERRARLVNIGAWENRGAEVDVTANVASERLRISKASVFIDYSPRDVLLPAILLPSCGGSADRAVKTLRPHQVDGIRFMWSCLVDAPMNSRRRKPDVEAEYRRYWAQLQQQRSEMIRERKRMANNNSAEMNRSLPPLPPKPPAMPRVDAYGCILAHSMGLGKTSQVTLFMNLFAKHVIHKPRIVIVTPKSTLSGWRNELAYWGKFVAEHDTGMHLAPNHFQKSDNNNNDDDGKATPFSKSSSPLSSTEAFKGLRTFIFDEDTIKRRQDKIRLAQEWDEQGGVLLLGYEGLVSLQNDLRNHYLKNASTNSNKGDNTKTHPTSEIFSAHNPVDLVICDEAHRLKSNKLQAMKALHKIYPIRRLLLTGTPLQNHLEEYWAMITFTMPSFFEKRWFRQFFIQPIVKAMDVDASPADIDLAKKKTFALIKEVEPFVQRVDSSPLKDELPPLFEYIIVMKLAPLQAQLYAQFIKLLVKMKSARDGSFNLLQANAYATKICGHPQLLYGCSVALEALEHQRQNQHKKGNLLTSSSSAANAKKNGGNGANNDEDDEGYLSSTTDDSVDSYDKHVAAKQKQRGRPRREGGGDDANEGTSRSEFVNTFGTFFTVPQHYTPKVEDSCKFSIAFEIIRLAKANDEKVLVFSFSTELLDLFQRMMKEAMPALTVFRIDGSTSGADRQDMIKRFEDRGNNNGGGGGGNTTATSSVTRQHQTKTAKKHSSAGGGMLKKHNKRVRTHPSSAKSAASMRAKGSKPIRLKKKKCEKQRRARIDSDDDSDDATDDDDDDNTDDEVYEDLVSDEDEHDDDEDASDISLSDIDEDGNIVSHRRDEDDDEDDEEIEEETDNANSKLVSASKSTTITGSSNSADVFLLSTKAGGVGLTLTAATRVIIIDTSFNPADDRQAVGRAYRYGQTQPVFVYRLVVEDSFEHRLLYQKVAKEWLFQTVVDTKMVNRTHLTGGLKIRDALMTAIPVSPQEEAKRRRSTAVCFRQDEGILLRLADKVAYVSEHNGFFEEGDEKYGQEEVRWYEDYQKRMQQSAANSGGMLPFDDASLMTSGGVFASFNSFGNRVFSGNNPLMSADPQLAAYRDGLRDPKATAHQLRGNVARDAAALSSVITNIVTERHAQDQARLAAFMGQHGGVAQSSSTSNNNSSAAASQALAVYPTSAAFLMAQKKLNAAKAMRAKQKSEQIQKIGATMSAYNPKDLNGNRNSNKPATSSSAATSSSSAFGGVGGGVAVDAFGSAVSAMPGTSRTAQMNLRSAYQSTNALHQRNTSNNNGKKTASGTSAAASSSSSAAAAATPAPSNTKDSAFSLDDDDDDVTVL